MSEFLKIAAPLMAIVSTAILFTGLITPLRRSKAFYFIVGALAFVTAIAFGCQAVLGGNLFAMIGTLAWFMAGSTMFGLATFRATEEARPGHCLPPQPHSENTSVWVSVRGTDGKVPLSPIPGVTNARD